MVFGLPVREKEVIYTLKNKCILFKSVSKRHSHSHVYLKACLIHTFIHSLTLLIKDMHAKGTGEEVETIHEVWDKGIQYRKVKMNND